MLYENTANSWYRMSEVLEAGGAGVVFTEYDCSPENYGNEESLCFLSLVIIMATITGIFFGVFWG